MIDNSIEGVVTLRKFLSKVTVIEVRCNTRSKQPATVCATATDAPVPAVGRIYKELRELFDREMYK